jgi:hypothetical protein
MTIRVIKAIAKCAVIVGPRPIGRLPWNWDAARFDEYTLLLSVILESIQPPARNARAARRT